MSKKVLITGASGGIGKSIADKLIDLDYNIIFTSSKIETINKLKSNYGDKHFYYELNLSKIDDLSNKLENIAYEHNDIEILINNAGTTNDALLLRMSWNQWKEVIDTNLNSNFLIIKSLLPNMIKKRKGKIIGISSVIANTGNPGQANYAASKAGMIAMYKSIALEVAQRNINVNIISPGFISTAMTEKLDEKQQNSIMNMIPSKKFGDPRDIANLVLFLVSDDSNYITGQTFHVNGGMLMV
tara:strand:- start:1370 stop:2095 length:726 start_codon:yes stop_codon:yes gene_type:complete